MSVLLPALERIDQRPNVFVGTSVGRDQCRLSRGREPALGRGGERGRPRALARGEQGRRDQADPAAAGAARRAALRGRGAVGAESAPAEPARPESAPGEPQPLGRLADPPPQRARAARRGDRGRGDGRPQRPHGGVRREHDEAQAPRVARDRLRARAPHARARARLGRDSDPVPACSHQQAGRRARLVLRRRHTPEHPDQAGARPRRRPAGGDRHGRRLRPAARSGPARGGGAAGLRRRRAPRAAGDARRPDRRGHAHPRQHQHVLRRTATRTAARRQRGGAALPQGARQAALPQHPLHIRGAGAAAARSASLRTRCSATATAA